MPDLRSLRLVLPPSMTGQVLAMPLPLTWSHTSHKRDASAHEVDAVQASDTEALRHKTRRCMCITNTGAGAVLCCSAKNPPGGRSGPAGHRRTVPGRTVGNNTAPAEIQERRREGGNKPRQQQVVVSACRGTAAQRWGAAAQEPSAMLLHAAAGWVSKGRIEVP